MIVFKGVNRDTLLPLMQDYYFFFLLSWRYVRLYKLWSETFVSIGRGKMLILNIPKFPRVVWYDGGQLRTKYLYSCALQPGWHSALQAGWHAINYWVLICAGRGRGYQATRRVGRVQREQLGRPSSIFFPNVRNSDQYAPSSQHSRWSC